MKIGFLPGLESVNVAQRAVGDRRTKLQSARAPCAYDRLPSCGCFGRVYFRARTSKRAALNLRYNLCPMWGGGMSHRSKEKNTPDNPERGLSRRAFLKTSGLGAAAVTVMSTGVAAMPDGTPKVIGPGAVPVTINVNGKALQTEVTPGTTLAEALRGPLNHTGTKVVCDRGSCSACTVWLDGMPVNSCMTLAIDVGARQVRTIEGLANGEALHPVQEAFIEHDALQCGYCTPGMVMSCAALLERNPSPTEADVRQATSGNLCRCGTYPKVFEATLAAAGRKGRQA